MQEGKQCETPKFTVIHTHTHWQLPSFHLHPGRLTGIDVPASLTEALCFAGQK